MNAQNVISNAQLAMVAKLTIVYHTLFLYISNQPHNPVIQNVLMINIKLIYLNQLANNATAHVRLALAHL